MMNSQRRIEKKPKLRTSGPVRMKDIARDMGL
jgi:hypothetical protein